LIKNPAEQLGLDGLVDKVRKHPFFEGIDWQALEEKRVNPPEKGKGGCQICALVAFLIYMEII
jgi:hypothetical protein